MFLMGASGPHDLLKTILVFVLLIVLFGFFLFCWYQEMFGAGTDFSPLWRRSRRR